MGKMYDEAPEPIHDRQHTHGDYKNQFALSQQLKSTVRAYRPLSPERAIPAVYMEAVEMICLKLSRIITGDPTFADHWEDIAGYAMRVVGK